MTKKTAHGCKLLVCSSTWFWTALTALHSFLEVLVLVYKLISAFCHMHTHQRCACLTLLPAEEGARMTELEALVATDVILPKWLQQLRYRLKLVYCLLLGSSTRSLQKCVHKLQYDSMAACRSGTSSISSLKEPKSLLQHMQKVVKTRQTSYEDELHQALEKLETRFSCLRDSPDFALILADRDLQLPAPLTSELFPQPKGSCLDVWVVPNSGLDVSATLPDQQKQLEIQDRQGVQLIAVTKQMPQEAAHLQYTCVAKSPLPLVAWAKILDKEKAEYVTHCAVIVDDSCSKHLMEDLHTLQQPVYKDIAARLDVSITTGLLRVPQASFSLRLNICQPQNRQHAMVGLQPINSV